MQPPFFHSMYMYEKVGKGLLGYPCVFKSQYTHHCCLTIVLAGETALSHCWLIHVIVLLIQHKVRCGLVKIQMPLKQFSVLSKEGLSIHFILMNLVGEFFFTWRIHTKWINHHVVLNIIHAILSYYFHLSMYYRGSLCKGCDWSYSMV